MKPVHLPECCQWSEVPSRGSHPSGTKLIREQEWRKLGNVGFEVFTAVTMKDTDLWDVTVKSEKSSVTYRKDALPPSSGS
jgi:hypothetical protein